MQAAQQSEQAAQMAQMHAMMQEMVANSNAAAQKLSDEIVAKQAAEHARFQRHGEQEMMQQEIAALHHRAATQAAQQSAQAAQQSAQIAAQASR